MGVCAEAPPSVLTDISPTRGEIGGFGRGAWQLVLLGIYEWIVRAEMTCPEVA